MSIGLQVYAVLCGIALVLIGWQTVTILRAPRRDDDVEGQTVIRRW